MVIAYKKLLRNYGLHCLMWQSYRMHRFVVLVAFGVASVLAALNEECLIFLDGEGTNCCKSPPIEGTKPPQYNDMTQCLDVENPEHTCEIEKCVAKIGGFLADDGNIDKKAYGAILSESYKERPKLVENIMKHCINADVKEYGLPDDCELNKIGDCVYLQYGMSCPEFDDQGKCSNMKELAEKCSA